MPFKSKAQARFMYSQKPELAEEFEKETPSIKRLPEKVKSKKSNPDKKEKMDFNIPTGSKSLAQSLSKKLGLISVHKMPNGKYHPGSSHKSMVNAIKRFNSSK